MFVYGDYCYTCPTFLSTGSVCNAFGDPYPCKKFNHVVEESITICIHCGKVLWKHESLGWRCGKWDFSEGGQYGTSCYYKYQTEEVGGVKELRRMEKDLKKKKKVHTKQVCLRHLIVWKG